MALLNFEQLGSVDRAEQLLKCHMFFDATAMSQTAPMASKTKPAMVLPNHTVDISELLRIVKLLQLLDFKGCLNHGY